MQFLGVCDGISGLVWSWRNKHFTCSVHCNCEPSFIWHVYKH